MNILIIDYGSGNVKSVYNSIKHLSETNSIYSKIRISSSTYDIDQIPMVEIFVNTPLDNGLKS